MSSTSRTLGETSKACTNAAVSSAFHFLVPISYCAKRISALYSGKRTNSHTKIFLCHSTQNVRKMYYHKVSAKDGN